MIDLRDSHASGTNASSSIKQDYIRKHSGYGDSNDELEDYLRDDIPEERIREQEFLQPAILKSENNSVVVSDKLEQLSIDFKSPKNASSFTEMKSVGKDVQIKARVLFTSLLSLLNIKHENERLS